MKQEYDFSRGTRGRIAPPEQEQRGKTRITIRLDEDVVNHFLREADTSGGTTGYQTLINEALRQHVEGKARSWKKRCGGLFARRCGPRVRGRFSSGATERCSTPMRASRELLPHRRWRRFKIKERANHTSRNALGEIRRDCRQRPFSHAGPAH